MNDDPIYNAKIGPLGLIGAGDDNIQREHLAIEVEQAKLNLRRAELSLKRHDDWAAARKEQAQAAKANRLGAGGSGMAIASNNNLNSQMRQAE